MVTVFNFSPYFIAADSPGWVSNFCASRKARITDSDRQWRGWKSINFAIDITTRLSKKTSMLSDLIFIIISHFPNFYLLKTNNEHGSMYSFKSFSCSKTMGALNKISVPINKNVTVAWEEHKPILLFNGNLKSSLRYNTLR